MSTFKTLLTGPGVQDAITIAFKVAEEYMTKIGREFRPEDATPVLDEFFTGDDGEPVIGLAWKIEPELTEAEALRATQDPRDRLIDNLYAQIKRLQLQVIALGNAQDLP